MSGASWLDESPFAAATVAMGKVSRSGLQADGSRFYWVEGRPAEGGRQVVVGDGGGVGPVEVSPADRSVRSRVHEYGGGAATVAGGVLFFVDQHDQQLYRCPIDGGQTEPVALTGAGAGADVGELVAYRYADGRLTPSGAWFVCVEEGHPAGGGPSIVTHRLVAVATDGSRRVVPLVGPDGLVAAPRPSPDGRQLAWVSWHHPHLPWDESIVWVADLVDETGRIGLGAPRRVAGGPGVSVGQPRWCRDGALLYVGDRTGWWMPYRWAGERDGALPLVDLRAELHAPDWALGQATLAELPDGSVVGRMHRDGQDHLVRLRPPLATGPTDRAAVGGGRGSPTTGGPAAAAPAVEAPSIAGSPVGGAPAVGTPSTGAPAVGGRSGGGGWTVEVVEQPCVTIAGVAATEDGTRIAVLGSTPTMAAAVVEVDPGRPGWWQPLSESPTLPVAAADVAVARVFVAPSPAGPIPGLLYLPPGAEADDDAPGPPAAGGDGATAALPPLVVFCHGGPTGAAEPGFDPVVQFFATRGIAVAAVDYRGSSGYGRRYRQSLQGLWGVADVDDCIAYAGALADAGLVDDRRMAVRGSSAGGLTALGALVRSDRFAGAASWYGVTDLEALAADTHDFESRYLDGLVGPLPGARARYEERSPLHHADRVSGSVLLLQGADDPVVPASQSERFAAELVACGVPCTFHVFPGESHGFRQATTIEACLEAELELYATVLAPPPPPARRSGDGG